MSFGNPPPKQIFVDQNELLQNFTKLYAELTGDIGKKLYQSHLNYLSKRSDLMKTHKHKLVYVTPDTVEIMNDQNHRPDNIGIMYLVGEETTSSGSNSYFSSVLNITMPVLPIGFGIKNSTNLWTNETGIVDTGCDITTFDINIYNQIINVDSRYENSTVKTSTYAVGGLTPVYQNRLDLDFCGQKYQNQVVYFTNINNKILIGRDLINNGIFNYESKRWISYSKH